LVNEVSLGKRWHRGIFSRQVWALMKQEAAPQAGMTTKRQWVGTGLLLLSGLGFASSIIIASMVIKRGVGVDTSNAVRYLIATILLFVYQKSTVKSVKIPPRERYIALGLGITVFIMGIGYLGATRYIPVSAAVLIFYTGPFFTIFISRFTEKEPITAIRIIALLVAFLGLFLALGVQVTNMLQMKGMLSALMAAIAMGTFVSISSVTIQAADPQGVNLHALMSGTLLFVVFLYTGDEPARAVTSVNLLKLCGSGFAIGIAYVAFYAGLKIIGPVKASMLMNTEPIFTIALAAAFFGEELSFMKIVGAGLVIIGIIAITRNSGSRMKSLPMGRKKVLFICTHNSARSQMAEGLVNALYSDKYQAYSAGTEASQVNPFAIEVMKEIGIDISHHKSKGLDGFLDQKLDCVITVCDHANETCPFLPSGHRRLHKGFEDPASVTGPDEVKREAFRRVRDQIREWLKGELDDICCG